jgi:hypothetical protein
MMMENMTQEQTHTLVRVSTYLSGAEEWLCPACGHRVMKTRLSGEQLLVLVDGDQQSRHDHSGDNLLPQNLQPLNLSRLAPWLDWINQIDFDQLKDDSSE